MNKIFALLAAALFLSGCVNVHVHFPPAPTAQAASADGSAGTPP